MHQRGCTEQPYQHSDTGIHRMGDIKELLTHDRKHSTRFKASACIAPGWSATANFDFEKSRSVPEDIEAMDNFKVAVARLAGGTPRRQPPTQEPKLVASKSTKAVATIPDLWLLVGHRQTQMRNGGNRSRAKAQQMNGVESCSLAKRTSCYEAARQKSHQLTTLSYVQWQITRSLVSSRSQNSTPSPLQRLPQSLQKVQASVARANKT